MFTTTYAEFETKQQEMKRQADHYRLVRSLPRPLGWAARLTDALGDLLIQLGRGLVAYAQAAR